MKKYLLLTTITLVALASVFLCSTAYAEGYSPWDVDLTVEYNGDVCRYNLSKEIARYADEATERGFYLGAKGKGQLLDSLLQMGLSEESAYEYLLPNFGKILRHFSYVERARQDATVSFDSKGFSYVDGVDGVAIDVDSLVKTAVNSKGNATRVKLPVTVDKAVSVAELKRVNVVKASFTTTFYNSNDNRSHNIARAVSSLNGTTVNAGETFSFNNTVGARTEANGYKTSKIILDGKYTDGVGGGVCQVSTTLYNALLLAGFIPKATQHSLVSSYVKAGFDAMVSYGVADLTFVNNTECPVYIGAKVKDKTVTFTVYGEPNRYVIERETVEIREPFSVIEVVDEVKYPELIYDDETKVVTSGSDGVKSKSYLNYYLDGKLIERKLIRSNVYKKVDKVVARGKRHREQPLPDGEQDVQIFLR